MYKILYLFGSAAELCNLFFAIQYSNSYIYPHIIAVNDLTIVSALHCFCLLLNIYH